jgi:AbrB family looped-hinge helix DNA binding protein
VALPKEVRQKLGLHVGTRLEVRLRGDEVMLKPIPREASTEQFLEFCRARAQGADLARARDILKRLNIPMPERVRQLREER